MDGHDGHDAWLLNLVGVCDHALERLSPDDPTVADLRADVDALRTTLHARLTETTTGSS